MMNSFSRLGILTLLFTTTASLHAAVLIEPFGSYHVGQSRQSGQANAEYKVTTYGARVGYHGLGAMAGVEYLTGEGTEDDAKAKLKPTNMGVFLGYTFPVLLRIYGVYSFDSKLDRTIDRTTESFTDGSSVKVGLGITSLSFVAINVEYVTTTFNKVNNVPVDHKYITGSYGLSLSFPIMF